MQIIGVVLIAVVVMLVIAYFYWSKRESRTEISQGGQSIKVIVKGAYSPNIIKATVGKPLAIEFDRQENSECSKRILIPDFNINQELPDFGKATVTIKPDKTGEFSFSCEMGMYQGKIIVE